MKKISILAVAAVLFLSFTACEEQMKKLAPSDNDGEEDVVDTVAMMLEMDDDTASVEVTEISIPNFVGIVEAFSSADAVKASSYLSALGMKEIVLNDDSVHNQKQSMIWTRGADFVNEHNGALALRFKSNVMHENSLALLVNKVRNQPSQIFFTQKQLVPLYVKELQSMGYELKPEKSDNQHRRYESADGDNDFEESFTIVIGDEGCAVVMQYDMEKEEKDE